MLAIPGETVLFGSPEADFMVTSHRIRANFKGWGQAHTISIMLEELCSSAVKYSSQPLLFPLAFFVFLGGGLTTLLVRPPATTFGSIIRFAPLCSGGVLAIGLVFLYFVTRHITLVFSSAGASIELDAMGMGLVTTEELIDTVEAAKDCRFLQSRMVPMEVYQPQGMTEWVDREV